MTCKPDCSCQCNQTMCGCHDENRSRTRFVFPATHRGAWDRHRLLTKVAGERVKRIEMYTYADRGYGHQLIRHERDPLPCLAQDVTDAAVMNA